MRVQQSYSTLGGGLDLVTPAIGIDPGRALIAVNYELPPQGGYRSVQGYERFDGRALASSATDAAAQAALRALIQPLPGSGGVLGVWWYNGVVYAWRNNALGTAALMYRATLAGWEAVSAPGLLPSGKYQFQNYNFYGQSSSLRCYGCDGVNPPFEFGGVFNIASVARDAGNVATIVTTAPHNLRNNDTVYVYNCVTAGFNASAVTVTVLNSTSFTYANTGSAVLTTADGSGRICVFAQISTGMGGGQISTATRSRTSNVSTISTATPHNLATGNLVQITGCADASFNTTSTTVTVTSASTFTYVNAGGNVATTVDATGRVYVGTGNAPQWIQAHAKVLFLAYPGGSLQFSAAGDPKNWSVIYQAGEIGVGSNISGLVSFKGQYLVIGTERGISTLTGTGPATWALIEFSATMGAVAGGMAEIGGQAHFMNTLGLSSMQTATVYGDFQAAIQSQAIDPFYFSSLSNLRFSVVSRKKTQMRTFYANGAVLISHFGISGASNTPGQTAPQFTTMVLPTNFVCGSNAGVSDDQIYLGDDAGYVYRMDSGSSFDGAPINCVLRLAFNQFQSPMNRKRFHRIQLEVVTPQVITLRFSADFDYSDGQQPTPQSNTFITSAGGATYWDQVNWDSFYWADNSIGTAVANVDGSGRNMGLIINSSETQTAPYTLQTAIVSYEVRGVQR